MWGFAVRVVHEEGVVLDEEVRCTRFMGVLRLKNARLAWLRRLVPVYK